MNITANNQTLPLLYEDSDVIAVAKPPQMLSQGAESGEASILDYLNAYAAGSWTAYPVHRLDRGTGGAMVFAKNKQAAAALAALAAGNGMQKTYLACVHGTLTGSATLEHDLYFDRKRNKSFPVKNSTRRGVKHASLSYEVLANGSCPAGEISLVKVRLHTGRTHQIRVQMAAIGHPLLGDGKYGGKAGKCSCALWSHSIVFDAEAIAATQLKNSAFAQAAQNIALLTSLPEGYPWDMFDTSVI